MQFFSLGTPGIYLHFYVDEKGFLKLVGLSSHELFEGSGFEPGKHTWSRLVELHISGGDQDNHHFAKHTGSSEAFTLKYVEHGRAASADERQGEALHRIVQQNDRLRVTTFISFYEKIGTFRIWNEVENIGEETVCIEHISLFSFVGVDLVAKDQSASWQDCVNVYVPHSAWRSEFVWKRYNVKELGLYDVSKFSGKRISASNAGTWSTMEYLPLGILENTLASAFLMWQIESSSTWSWEISTMSGRLYLMLNSASYTSGFWVKKLEKGQVFQTDKAALTLGTDAEQVLNRMNSYRRAIRRVNGDNASLPVIFNDYMNCLFANPTDEKLRPVIDAAALLGSEYYCLDSGWYCDGYWWNHVGDWIPSKQRFKNGLKPVMNYIREKGMKPGIWLELESISVTSQTAESLPDDCFFMRNGKKVIDHGRYQLDYSHPEVRKYADGVIDKVVKEFGVQYIKLDYNINGGMGTEVNSDSVGEGLMRHMRAYLGWLDGVIARYPDMIIESCASGGSRIDYGILSRLSIQSTSDQENYKFISAIAVNSVSAMPPEQAAVWSCPQVGSDAEAVVYNLINSMLLRVHQSGAVMSLPDSSLDLIGEGIALYKQYRRKLAASEVFLPCGFASFDAPFAALGVDFGGEGLLAVFNQNNEDEVVIDLTKYGIKEVELYYPQKLPTRFSFAQGKLTFHPEQGYSARLLSFTK